MKSYNHEWSSLIQKILLEKAQTSIKEIFEELGFEYSKKSERIVVDVLCELGWVRGPRKMIEGIRTCYWEKSTPNVITLVDAKDYTDKHMAVEDIDLNYEMIDKKMAKQEKTISGLQDTNILLRRELRQLKRELNTYENCTDRVELTIRPKVFQFSSVIENTEEHSASMCLIISDVHCGKVISENQVMNLNSFDHTILINRMNNLLNSFIKIINIQSAKTPIDGIHLFAIGDLIQGYLRNTDWVNCEFTPMEQVAHMTEVLITFIDQLIEHTKLPIHIVLQAGNHGRMSSMAKMPSTDRVALCYETIIGESLKLAYRSEALVDITIPYGYDYITNIKGINVLSHHGDSARISNKSLARGIAGIAPALCTYYEKLQEFMEFDLSILGHYHCASNLSNKIIVNGSVCGTDPFAFKLGYHEEPTQVAFLIDSIYGVTSTWNINLN